MQAIHHFETFLLAGILLNLTPGNDTIFILTKSMAQGKKAGIISALGIGTGGMVHTLFAALGLSIIIAKSILLFNVIKYAGAVYLLYMGYKMITDKSQLGLVGVGTFSSSNFGRIYFDAIITNVLNPKVALFFIAFLPQFINPGSGGSIFPFLILGTTFIFTGTIWCLILAVFASAIFRRLKENEKASSYLNKVCGITLVGLGIKVALADRK